MKLAFTSFDKAIVAAILAPLLALAVNWVGGGEVDEKTIIAAVVAGLVAGISVYLKGNLPTSTAAPKAP
jgi:hypothetical protein